MVAPGTLCYLFRRLISLAEGKAGVLEWLEQFLQLAGSLDVQMPDDDVEWMVAKAWNVVRDVIVVWSSILIGDRHERDSSSS